MVGPWRIDCVMERGSFAYEAFSKKPLLAETNDVRRRAQADGTEDAQHDLRITRQIYKINLPISPVALAFDESS
uniref:HDC00756 n=1 Tax=Drosophila melanogaster TaxID=7227 RepID=Q6IHW0_DROME|nr:TPA_inf: HDC00756 [Drosophila melanogaster]